jgi:hypothetical protein
MSPEPVFVKILGAQESLPRKQFRQAGNRFLGSLKGLTILALASALGLPHYSVSSVYRKKISDCYWSEINFLSLVDFHYRETRKRGR